MTSELDSVLSVGGAPIIVPVSMSDRVRAYLRLHPGAPRDEVMAATGCGRRIYYHAVKHPTAGTAGRKPKTFDCSICGLPIHVDHDTRRARHRVRTAQPKTMPCPHCAAEVQIPRVRKRVTP